MARFQHGWLTKKSGSWMGHYARRSVDAATGNVVRHQRAFVVGRTADLTRSQTMMILRERVQRELGLKADNKATLAWFVKHRWQPLREGTWRESTRGTNLWVLSCITKRFGTVALEDLDAVQMQAWLNDLAKHKSGSVVKHCRIFLRSILDEATEQDFIRKSPAKRLKVPVTKPVNKTFLSVPQIAKLLKAAKPSVRDWTLLRLELVTGLRPSELFMLRWRGLDVAQRTIRIEETIYRGAIRKFTKTTEQDAREFVTVFVPKTIVKDLERWRTQSGWSGWDDLMFPSPNGTAWWKENYERRVLLPLRERAGVDRLNFQIFRRTCATHAQHLGSPKDIATIMRHRKTETSQAHYIQAMDSSVRQTSDRLAAVLLGT